MRQAPRLRGGLTIRVPGLFLGLVLIAVAIVSVLESGLGLAPWDVFHLGLAEHTALTLGTATIVVGLAVMLLAWALGQAPGFGTVANAVVIGLVVDALLAVRWVTELSRSALPARIALLAFGVALFGVGIGVYVAAGLGAGPRDSLMLVLSRRAGIRIAFVRAALDVLALVAGWALGGTVGLGTLVVAVLLGPAVEASFWLLLRLGIATTSTPATVVAVAEPG